jgi:hypothetical protein
MKGARAHRKKTAPSFKLGAAGGGLEEIVDADADLH